MISHRNVIANAMCHGSFERPARLAKGIETQAELGLLPMSHIYALVVITHTGGYRGDEIIVLPKFELETFLQAIERFKIALMRIVSITKMIEPPLIEIIHAR